MLGRGYQHRPVRLAFCVGLVLWCAASCRPAVPPAHPQRWARAWINSMNSQRLVQVAPLLGDSGTYADPGTPDPLSGEALGLYLANQWRVFPQLHYQLRGVTGDVESVAVEWTATGLGFAGGAAPIDGVFVMHLRDGTITSVRAYYDAGKLFAGR